MNRTHNRRARSLGLRAVVSSAALLVLVGHPVHADDDPVAEPPVNTGQVGGAVVAVGLPPVPPTTVVVAVGLPPVPPTTVVVAVGLPPVPPTTVAVASDPPSAPSVQSGRVGGQPQAVHGIRRSAAVDVTDVIADMIATVESAVALIDSQF